MDVVELHIIIYFPFRVASSHCSKVQYYYPYTSIRYCYCPFFPLPTRRYTVTGADAAKSVGQVVEVNCKESHQFLKEDRWDTDAADNTLTLRCKPSEEFDVPYSKDLPGTAGGFNVRDAIAAYFFRSEVDRSQACRQR